jgi:methionyl aminopeptidase
MKTSSIRIKSSQEIDILRKAGKILYSIISQLESSLTAGMTTNDIDAQAFALMQKNSVKPAFKGYRGFPASVCVSVNEAVVHGIPDERIIQKGDIVSIDVGIVCDDYFSDTALTVGVGPISPQNQKLLEVTEAALYKGIEKARTGAYLSDISNAVQTHVESFGLSVVRDFVGHGIGRQLHEDPEIPNYGPPHQGPILKEGMVLAIEPMVNLGSHRTKILKDGWTVVTEDRKPSAHFEHCILITAKEAEILTR